MAYHPKVNSLIMANVSLFNFCGRHSGLAVSVHDSGASKKICSSSDTCTTTSLMPLSQSHSHTCLFCALPHGFLRKSSLKWCRAEVRGSRPPHCYQRDLFLGSPEFKSSVMLCKYPTGPPPASWDF